jgi:hypothetical protein
MIEITVFLFTVAAAIVSLEHKCQCKPLEKKQ